MIDKVIDATGAEKIYYGGHSMGTTSFMVMANKKPEYQEKIILANFLAPIAFVDHMTSPLRYIAPFAGSIDVSFSTWSHSQNKMNEITVPELFN